MASDKKIIVVIGAGVTGLQTSISLLQAGYQVLIIAQYLPGEETIEYTSPWAGAHWRSHAPHSDPEQQQWDTETYNHWLELIDNESQNDEKGKLSGLGLRKSYYYSTSSEPPWFSSTVLDYAEIPTTSLKKGLQHGHSYSSVMINVPMYLNYLLEAAKSLGATIVKATLPSCPTFSETLRAAFDILKPHLNKADASKTPQVSAFVNATGISALKLVPDLDVYPVRGQTVTVAGESNKITTVDGFPTDASLSINPITYVLPRPHSNTTVLGGTKQVGNWTAEPDPKTTKEILRQAKEWAPELLNEKGEFEAIGVQVGLRPGRNRGARVEIEVLDGIVVCHAYGHAGAGYQNSVGSANKVVRLLEEYCSKA